MPDDFRFDVFLSHSSKDKPVVRDIFVRAVSVSKSTLHMKVHAIAISGLPHCI